MRGLNQLLLVVSVLAAWPASRALAQAEYPSQPIKVVIANSPGSATDNLMRVVSGRVSALLGQQFVIINQAGAGGTIGAEIVARAAPDGYTLLATSVPTQAISPHLYPNARYKPLEDFAPVTMVAKTENVLVVAAEQPMRSVSELVAYAKANPGKLDMANAGSGAQSHLAGTLFAKAAGIDVVHVPYKGAASVMAVMGNQSHLTIAPLPAVLPGIHSGKLRALAIAGRTRSALLRDVPTMGESGYQGLDLVGWSAIIVPKATPRPIIEKLRDAFHRGIGEPSTREGLLRAGGEPWPTSPEELMRIMTEDLARYGEAVRASGAKVE